VLHSTPDGGSGARLDITNNNMDNKSGGVKVSTNPREKFERIDPRTGKVIHSTDDRRKMIDAMKKRV
jgi:hypothetical protein